MGRSGLIKEQRRKEDQKESELCIRILHGGYEDWSLRRTVRYGQEQVFFIG